MSAKFPGQENIERAMEDVRATADFMRSTLEYAEQRMKAAFVTAADEEICYVELFLRQTRAQLEEIDKKIGHLKDLNAKRVQFSWLKREIDTVKMYGHSFRLDLHLLPSLPKKGTAERQALIKWLQDGNRSDCLVMDEATGEWTFDYDKMEELVNKMVEEGNQPPASIKLHPKAKIIVRSLKD